MRNAGAFPLLIHPNDLDQGGVWGSLRFHFWHELGCRQVQGRKGTQLIISMHLDAGSGLHSGHFALPSIQPAALLQPAAHPLGWRQEAKRV